MANDRGAGRPPLDSEGRMEEKSVRMLAWMWRIVRERGGSKYLRDLVMRDVTDEEREEAIAAKSKGESEK